MRPIVRKSRFRKDFKKLVSSGKKMEKLAEVLRTGLNAAKKRTAAGKLALPEAGYKATTVAP